MSSLLRTTTKISREKFSYSSSMLVTEKVIKYYTPSEENKQNYILKLIGKEVPVYRQETVRKYWSF